MNELKKKSVKRGIGQNGWQKTSSIEEEKSYGINKTVLCPVC